MKWTELKITIPCEKVDEAAAIAQIIVPHGFYIEDYSNLEEQVKEIAHIDIIDKDLLEKQRDNAIIHIYMEPDINPSESIAFLKERLNSENIPCDLFTEKVDDEDWATAWQKYYHAMRIGKKIMVCPQWEEEECETNEGDIKLILNPGMAFGTGTHETTKLCMEHLEKYIQPGDNVLDVGCGSGILTITSMLLGAKSAKGIDIDPIAVKVAGENAALNNIDTPSCNFIYGDLTEKISGDYDVICANIVADVIIKLCENITDFMHNGSILLCSGIIDSRKEEVIEAIEKAGLNINEINQDNSWLAIVCEK